MCGLLEGREELKLESPLASYLYRLVAIDCVACVAFGWKPGIRLSI